MITLVCILIVPRSQLLNSDDGAWTCLFLNVLKNRPQTWKRGNRIANMTIVIMSTNQISYVTKPGPKCFSIWRKNILILGLKKMAYMWHYFSFSQKVGCYSKEDQHTQSNISVVSPKGGSWSYCNKCTTCFYTCHPKTGTGFWGMHKWTQFFL
jgi:hypothetical protein